MHTTAKTFRHATPVAKHVRMTAGFANPLAHSSRAGNGTEARHVIIDLGSHVGMDGAEFEKNETG